MIDDKIFVTLISISRSPNAFDYLIRCIEWSDRILNIVDWKGSSLIRVHSVSFHDKIKSLVHVT